MNIYFTQNNYKKLLKQIKKKDEKYGIINTIELKQKFPETQQNSNTTIFIINEVILNFLLNFNKRKKIKGVIYIKENIDKKFIEEFIELEKNFNLSFYEKILFDYDDNVDREIYYYFDQIL